MALPACDARRGDGAAGMPVRLASPLGVRVAPQDAHPRLTEDLLDPRHKRVQMLAQPLECGLLDDGGGAFDAGANLLRKSLRLSHDATGGREQC